MRLLMSALGLLLSVDALAARGAVAFHYASPLTPAQLELYGRFDVLVTHDPLPRAQLAALRAKGTRVALYEWAVAFYRTTATPWQRGLTIPALLNAQPLRGHLGSPDADAFYFDPASPEHERERARTLITRLRTHGYDSVFFDTTTQHSVHPDALAEYARRHPDVPYDVAFARFLRVLRRELNGGVVITNQGYRAAEHVLPYADVDISESLVTRPVDGRFVLRPWHDPRDEWNSIAFLMRNLVAPAQRAYPRVRFVHVNYLDAPDAASVARIVGICKLFDAEGFVTTPALDASVDSPAYFEDLGTPRRRIETATSAYRFFARGLIAANFGRDALAIANGERATYENLVTGERTRARRIVVPPNAVAIYRRR